MTRNGRAPHKNGAWHAGTWCPILREGEPSGALVERTENKGEEPTSERQGDATPRVPIRMPPTSRSAYVTGHIVLALQHPSIGMGFNWWAQLVAPPGAVAFRSDDALFSRAAAVTRRAIGDAEIADLRPALAEAKHPDAASHHAVWGATHVRAALEIAWETHKAIARGGESRRIEDTYDGRTMRVWLSARERERATEMGRAMARVEQDEDAERWHAWLETLTE